MKHGVEKRSRGFTLIELLVVISIIGMLASIVLSGLSSARYKARTQAMKSGFTHLRTALEIFYENNNNTWGNLQSAANCPNTAGTLFGDPDVRAGLNAIQANFAGSTLECLSGNDYTATNPAITWVIEFSAPAQSGGGTNKWCMDNSEPSGRKSLLGGHNSSGQKRVSGAAGYFVYDCIAYSSPNW